MSLIALICRHGETELNADNKFRSWLDVELNDKGQEQAKELADELEKYPIDIIYSSPLYRTIQTSKEYSSRSGLEIKQHRGLFPWNLGVLAGTDKDENKDVLRMFVENPDVKVINGESLKDFENRSAEFYTEILSKGYLLPVLFTHTSNIIVLDGLINGEKSNPEKVEIVKPGGICGIYKTEHWMEIKPIFRKADKVEV